jgi:hypothetical protein
LQVDLFNKDVVAKASRQRKALATRPFVLDKSYREFNGLDEFFSSPSDLRRYKEHLNLLLAEGRKISYIGDAECDNMFELEALNLSRSSRMLSMVVDFSDCLDLVLNRAYGCKIDDIRRIDDYSVVSRSILNYDFKESIGSDFGKLLDASEDLEKSFIELSNRTKEMDMYYHDRLPWVVFQFYETVLGTLSHMKWCTVLQALREMEGAGYGKGVIRSSSYSSIVATVESSFNEMVELKFNDGFSYSVAFRTYRTYEYVGEVLRNDVGWKIYG